MDATAINWLIGLGSIGLFVYLLYVLICPERF